MAIDPSEEQTVIMIDLPLIESEVDSNSDEAKTKPRY